MPFSIHWISESQGDLIFVVFEWRGPVFSCNIDTLSDIRFGTGGAHFILKWVALAECKSVAGFTGGP